MRREDYLRSIRFIENSNTFISEGSGQLIAKSVISHVSEIQDLTLDLLAEDTYLSDASISRFFKKAGFGSFHQFKYEFSDFMMNQKITMIKDGFTDTNPNETMYLDSFRSHYGNVLEQVSAAAAMMADASHVLMTGEMFDLIPFFDLQVSLISNAIGTYFCRLSELPVFPERILKGKTLIFAILENSSQESLLQEMKEKTDASLICAGREENRNDLCDLYISLPLRTKAFHDSTGYSLLSAYLLHEFLKLKGMRTAKQ